MDRGQTSDAAPDIFTALHARAVTIPQLREASQLRNAGMSYRDITIAMSHFRGAHFCTSSWRAWLRQMGHEPVKAWNGHGAAAQHREAA